MADTVAERECRRVWIHVSDELLLGLLTSGEHPNGNYRVTENAIPEKTRIITVRHHIEQSWREGDPEGARRVEFLLESEEYPLVPEGGVVPVTSSPVVETIPEDEDE